MIKYNSQFSTLDPALCLPGNSQLISVAIVEDHKVVIDGVEKNIVESGIACLIGKAYSISGCWEMLAEKQPDVLLLDVGLPDGSGMDLCPQIKSKYPAMNILMLTNYAEYVVISHVLNNGASGYILKNAMPEEIIEGIRTVSVGKRFLCENVNLLLNKEDKKVKIILTRRENELLKLIIEGHTNQEISDKMCLGYLTIKSYRKNLFQKLEVHNTLELMKKAIELKIV